MKQKLFAGFYLCLQLLLLICFFQSKVLKAQDTIFLKKKSTFYLNDSLYRTLNDTLFILQPGQEFVPLDKDSLFYQKLNQKGVSSKFLQEILSLTLRPNARASKPNEDLTDDSDKWEAFQGLTISKITIRQPPVGGFSFTDTTFYSTKLTDIIQSLHVYTKVDVIKKNLYFNEGDSLNAWVVVDNEKYIRNLSFIEEARFYPKNIGNDSIELLLIVQDKIPYGIFPEFHSQKKQSLRIWNTNFLGYGNEIGGGLTHQKNESPELYLSSLYFTLNNLKKQFIQNKIAYTRSPDEKLLNMKIGRNYLAQAYQLAGGIELGYSDINLPHWINPDTTLKASTAYVDGNIWAGYQIELNKVKRKSKRPAYLFPAIGIENRYHIDRPLISSDSNIFLSNRTNIYASLSILSQDFVSSEKLFAQGLSQTLPIGIGLSLTSGFSFGEFYNMPYLGIRVVNAQLTKNQGYLLSQLQFGTFFHENSLKQGAFIVSLNHLSKLIGTGKYTFRTSTGIRYTLGINRDTYDSLFLNNSNGIKGLSTNALKGFQRLNANLEFIIYTPWKWIGFHFTPYFIFETGLIGDPKRSIFKNRFVSAFGVGIRLRNEFLVFSSIQLRFLYYPYTPPGAANYSIDVSDDLDFDYFDFNPTAPGQVRFK
ncbi:MAG: hypothetical protein PF694_07225 [Bacteroidetes bacterium]|jgi:hypothetical protein|nr:hypothetical protein [Bacteroidota bacterium]